jgi:hypothetical protein
MKLLLALDAGATLAAFGGQAAAPPLVALRAARLIGGRRGAPIAPAVVIIRGERLETAGSGLAIPAGARDLAHESRAGRNQELGIWNLEFGIRGHE